MPGGRPTKYRPEMCEEAIEMFRDGRTVVEVCAKFMIHKDTFYEWIKQHEEFSDAARLGKHLSESYWVQKGRDNLCNRDINVGIWNSLMRNMFGWDKEQKHSVDIRLSFGEGSDKT